MIMQSEFRRVMGLIDSLVEVNQASISLVVLNDLNNLSAFPSYLVMRELSRS